MLFYESTSSLRPFLNYLCLILLFSISFAATASLNNSDISLESDSPQVKTCKTPSFLHPDASELTERFSNGEISYTRYLEQFIWLEPELESYALCIVCTDEEANHSPFEVSYPSICSFEFLNSPFSVASSKN